MLAPPNIFLLPSILSLQSKSSPCLFCIEIHVIINSGFLLVYYYFSLSSNKMVPLASLIGRLDCVRLLHKIHQLCSCLEVTLWIKTTYIPNIFSHCSLPFYKPNIGSRATHKLFLLFSSETVCPLDSSMAPCQLFKSNISLWGLFLHFFDSFPLTFLQNHFVETYVIHYA